MPLSQEELAEKLGVTRVAVSHWESGKVLEIEREFRLGLCKELGFDEVELLLDQDGAAQEFTMPLSREAKSIAYRFDDMPQTIRSEIAATIARIEHLKRTNPRYYQEMFPETAVDEKPKDQDPK